MTVKAKTGSRKDEHAEAYSADVQMMQVQQQIDAIKEEFTSDHTPVDALFSLSYEIEALPYKARAAQLPRIIRAIAEALE